MSRSLYFPSTVVFMFRGEKYRRDIRKDGQVKWYRMSLFDWSPVNNDNYKLTLEEQFARLKKGELQ